VRQEFLTPVDINKKRGMEKVKMWNKLIPEQLKKHAKESQRKTS